MAGARSSALPYRAPILKTPNLSRKPLPILASFSPSRPRRRKNHLRPKILRTLTKTYSPSPSLSPQEPIIPTVSPKIPIEEGSFSENETVSGKIDRKDDEFAVSDTVAEVSNYNGSSIGFSAASYLRFGAFLIGAFVFQTVFAVWVLGNANSRDQNGELGKRDLGVDRNDRRKNMLNGNGGFSLDNLEEKIEEIRAMAAEARRVEEKESNYGEKDANSKSRIGIEKEVDARIENLQKKLSLARGNLLDSYGNCLRKSRTAQDDKGAILNSDLEEKNEMLVFKKKLKFKSPSVKARDKPKGFNGLDGRSVSRSKNRSRGGVEKKIGKGRERNNLEQQFPEKKKVSLGDGELSETPKKRHGSNGAIKELNSVGNGGKQLEEQSEGTNKGMQYSGNVQETVPHTAGRDQNENAGALGRKSPQHFGREYGVSKPDADLVFGKSNGLRCTEVGKTTNKVEQSDTKSDLWWLKLPYVLAILMQRGGSRQDREAGLYTLKMDSETQDDGVVTYTVAFEDRGDANNFCFLLESFFEELGDFSADIVPLLRKELHDAVKSGTMKIIVLRKGQLQLYAGQPLADVEKALRLLVDQN